MKKMTVKDLIDFRSKSKTAKKNFIAKLKQDKEKEKDLEGGGHYWITGLSAISNAYKENDSGIIVNKINELQEKHENAEHENTKIMYQRNINLLYDYEEFDFAKWRPSKKLTFLTRRNTNSIIDINGLQIKASRNHAFLFGKSDSQEIGAIWFIAKQNGYGVEDLGIFSEVLYRYLIVNYANQYSISSKYCIAVDVVNKSPVNYSQLQSGKIPSILDKVIDEIQQVS